MTCILRYQFQEPRTGSTGAPWTMFALNPVADDHEHRPNGVFAINADGKNLRRVLGGNYFKREFEWRIPSGRNAGDRTGRGHDRHSTTSRS